MSLQRRLTVFFVIIVAVPLAVAGIFVQRLIVGEIHDRATMALDPALSAAAAVYSERAASIDAHVHAAVDRAELSDLLAAVDRRGIESFLADALIGTDVVDFLVIFDKDGDVLGYSQRPGEFAAGFTPPTPDDIVDPQTISDPGVARGNEIPIAIAGAGRVASAVGGFWLDAELLGTAASEDVDVSLASSGRVIASTIPLSDPVDLESAGGDETFGADIGGEVEAQARPLVDGLSLVASTPSAPISSKATEVSLFMLGVLALTIASTSVLAYVLARLITQPLDELAEGARAIAEGNFGHRMTVRSKDEVGQLASAFNNMTERLKETIDQLYSSRNQLQRAVRRVGETLRSTHDMKQMLDSILHTAGDALDADVAILWMFTPTREEVYPAIVRGMRIDPMIRIRVGDGIVGLVAERGIDVILPTQRGGPRAARDEPALPVSVAVPVYGEDRISGVLSIYRHDARRVFTREELDTLLFLVEQGGVAIENVALHEEAKRLSLTDGLTGIWNRRYFQMQFRQVLATSIRFERPFSVLMLDLDRFKLVNDTYGHQRGDATLVEFSQRVAGVLREVDTFARYGGEEFICLLSETDAYGAVTTAEKIRETIKADPFGTDGEQPIALTVSIGASSYPDHGASFRSLVEAADQAMYRAKQEGRDRVRLAGEPPPPLQLAK